MTAALRLSAILPAFFIFSVSIAFAQKLPVPSHIVVVILENHAYTQVIGNDGAPHMKKWCDDPNTAVFTLFHGVEHPSQPNYLDLFSGNNQGVTDDDVPSNYPFTTPNLGAELIGASRSFVTFSEGLPEMGFDGAINRTAAGPYTRKHNPAANWVNKNNPGPNQLPPTVSQPLTAFPNASNFQSLPTVSLVVPTLTDDMHDGHSPANISLADQWLYDHFESLRNWAVHNNTLFIITFDEDDGFHNNVIPVIFYGPMVKGGTYAENLNHFNLLRTIEDMYGTGHAGKAVSATPITDCWK
jgi:hypothetical protein